MVTLVPQTVDVMISLAKYTGLVNDVNETKMEATFRAGTPLRNMSLALDEKGYAMIQLGSVAGQSIAGAISTGEIMGTSFAFKLTYQSTLLHSCLTTHIH